MSNKINQSPSSVTVGIIAVPVCLILHLVDMRAREEAEKTAAMKRLNGMPINVIAYEEPINFLDKPINQSDQNPLDLNVTPISVTSPARIIFVVEESISIQEK